MTMNLDLSGSRAKWERAAEHFEMLNREMPFSIHERKPYSIITDLNEETGWLSVKFKPEAIDIRFSVVLGELIHNLRSALDHIVSTLVGASGIPLTRSHQFPIYVDEAKFDRAVGTAAIPIGCLHGIRFGFDEIRSFQPFQLQPDPSQAATAGIHRLSNSDKHRSIVGFAPLPQEHQLRITHNGQIIDQWQPTGDIEWEPGVAIEVQRIRFSRPYPTQLDPEADLKIATMFRDAPFPPEYSEAILVGLQELRNMCHQTRLIIDRMATL